MAWLSGITRGFRNVQRAVQNQAEPVRNQPNPPRVNAPARQAAQPVPAQQRAQQSSNTIGHMSANLAPRTGELIGAPGNAGAANAQSAVRVDSQDMVVKRDRYGADAREIAREARTRAEDLFRRQNTATIQTPFLTSPEQQAEQVTKDAQGNVTRIERATRTGDNYTYENITYENGTAQRQSLATGFNRATNRIETWKQQPGKHPSQPSSDELMRQAQNGRAEIHELTIERNGAQTVVREVDADIKGRSSTTQTFSRQTHRDGIHGDLDPKFKEGQTIEVLEIEGTRKGWCEKEQVIKTKTFSQGNTTATSSIVRDDKGNESKLWSLEIQDGNLYEKQDFIEGNNDFRSVTTRRANGSVVTEEVKTQYKKDGKRVHPSSNQVTAFNSDGTVRKMERRSTSEEHVITKQVYERTQKETARGLEINERTQTVQTGWENENELVQRQTIQETTSIIGPNGFELVGARHTLVGPEGRAQASITPNGQRLSFDGLPINTQQELDGMPANHRDFVKLSQEALAAQIKFYEGPAAPEAAGGATLPDGKTPRAGADVNRVKAFVGASRDTLNALKPAISGIDARDIPKISFGNNRLIAQEITATNVGALSTTLGLIGSGLNLHQSLQQGNYLQAAVDGASFTAAGVSVPATVTQFVKAARAGVPLGYVQASDGVEIAANGTRFADVAGPGLRAFRTGVKIAGPAAAVLGFGVSAYDLHKAWQTGDTSQKVAAGVSVVGSGVGLGIAVASAMGWGSLGGPWGAAVGAGVGLAGYGISQGINWIADDAHDIPKVVIGD